MGTMLKNGECSMLYQESVKNVILSEEQYVDNSQNNEEDEHAVDVTELQLYFLSSTLVQYKSVDISFEDLKRSFLLET